MYENHLYGVCYKESERLFIYDLVFERSGCVVVKRTVRVWGHGCVSRIGGGAGAGNPAAVAE